MKKLLILLSCMFCFFGGLNAGTSNEALLEQYQDDEQAHTAAQSVINEVALILEQIEGPHSVYSYKPFSFQKAFDLKLNDEREGLQERLQSFEKAAVAYIQGFIDEMFKVKKRLSAEKQTDKSKEDDYQEIVRQYNALVSYKDSFDAAGEISIHVFGF